jgi:hypothetical protein
MGLNFCFVLLNCVSLIMSKDDDLLTLFISKFTLESSTIFFHFYYSVCSLWKVWSLHITFCLFFNYLFVMYIVPPNLYLDFYYSWGMCVFACVPKGINTNHFLDGLNFIKTYTFKIRPWKCPLCFSESHLGLDSTWVFFLLSKQILFHIGLQLQYIHFWHKDTKLLEF